MVQLAVRVVGLESISQSVSQSALKPDPVSGECVDGKIS